MVLILAPLSRLFSSNWQLYNTPLEFEEFYSDFYGRKTKDPSQRLVGSILDKNTQRLKSIVCPSFHAYFLSFLPLFLSLRRFIRPPSSPIRPSTDCPSPHFSLLIFFFTASIDLHRGLCHARCSSLSSISCLSFHIPHRL